MSLADLVIQWAAPAALLVLAGGIGLSLACLVSLRRDLAGARDACHLPELCKHLTAGGKDFCEECRS